MWISVSLCFVHSFILPCSFTMATDHHNPASKQQQPGTSAFKVRRRASYKWSPCYLVQTSSFLPPSWPCFVHILICLHCFLSFQDHCKIHGHMCLKWSETMKCPQCGLINVPLFSCSPIVGYLWTGKLPGPLPWADWSLQQPPGSRRGESGLHTGAVRTVSVHAHTLKPTTGRGRELWGACLHTQGKCFECT